MNYFNMFNIFKNYLNSYFVLEKKKEILKDLYINIIFIFFFFF